MTSSRSKDYRVRDVTRNLSRGRQRFVAAQAKQSSIWRTESKLWFHSKQFRPHVDVTDAVKGAAFQAFDLVITMLPFRSD
jgi:hypothetical protein